MVAALLSQLVDGELADEAKVEGPVPASPEANNEDAAEVNRCAIIGLGGYV